ncbi:hypothetical protein HCN44_001481 [Aphidius gifuensis]|uniref:Proteasome assembly chaperone 3 n=1 Tax=Aphidius gifuensis TaxID=684658 RepID=A0A834XSS0_APHGI|nr:hypothetical protein HCN44_001481 [Aphidius gifuensis]
MVKHACAVLIDGIHTDIVTNIYKDRVFLIITQYKKFGCMINVSRESSLKQFNSHTYSTEVVFGKDTEEINAVARYIGEAIDIDRPLLLSLALKSYEPKTIKKIIQVINKIKTW